MGENKTKQNPPFLASFFLALYSGNYIYSWSMTPLVFSTSSDTGIHGRCQDSLLFRGNKLYGFLIMMLCLQNTPAQWTLAS